MNQDGLKPFDAAAIAKICYFGLSMMIEETAPPMLGKNARNDMLRHFIERAQCAYVQLGLEDKLELILQRDGQPQSWEMKAHADAGDAASGITPKFG